MPLLVQPMQSAAPLATGPPTRHDTGQTDFRPRFDAESTESLEFLSSSDRLKALIRKTYMTH